MSGIATAIVGSAVIGGAVASRGASKAADAQTQAAQTASDTELAMFNQNREDYAPWREAGVGALGQLASGLGIRGKETFDEQAYLAARPDAAAWLEQKRQEGDPQTAYDHYVADGSRQPGVFGESSPGFGEFNRDFSLADFQADPGYQFRQSEGQRMLEGSAAGRGGLLSGATLKALSKYGQDLASQEYGSAYNRYNADLDRRFNRLSGIAGTGQTATRDVAQLGSQTAQSIGQNQIGAGNARASGYVGQANAIGGAVNSAGQYMQLRDLMKTTQPVANPGWYSGGQSWGGSAADPWYG